MGFKIVDESPEQEHLLKVVGIGGGGGNAVDYMSRKGLRGVDILAMDTDTKALNRNSSPLKLLIGEAVTQGKGAGGLSSKGKEAATQDKEKIVQALEGAEMAFLIAGLGKGTGTGSCPMIAQWAKELGILTMAMVTLPFSNEGDKRASLAQDGLRELTKEVDTYLVLPNQKLIEKIAQDTPPVIKAFEMAHEFLFQIIQSIYELIQEPGLKSLGFADLKRVMSIGGPSLLGIGQAKGEGRALHAVEQAVSSPFLNGADMKGAKGVLVNLTADPHLPIDKWDEAILSIRNMVNEEADIDWGLIIKEDMEDEVRLTLIATGIESLQKDCPESESSEEETITPSKKDMEIPAYLRYQGKKVINPLAYESGAKREPS